MKHALSWQEFKYNFSQINRTVEGKAKVIIAGRPNAFLSDTEHNWALRGVAGAGVDTLKIPGAPAYIEIEVQPFSSDEAAQFLRAYLTYRITCTRDSSAISGEDVAWIESRIVEFEKIKSKSDLLRPVHLRIFGDIASDRSVAIRDYSVYELYAAATNRIAEREAEKPQRNQVDSSMRQEVIEEMAWRVWDEGGGRRLYFLPSQVSSSLIRRAFPENSDLTDQQMQRELFSGSFIERKHGSIFSLRTGRFSNSL